MIQTRPLSLWRGTVMVASMAAMVVLASPRARADEASRRLGHGESALPAVDTVPVFALPTDPLRFNAALGYGYTESVLDTDDAHHRSEAAVALSYAPIEALTFAARFDARLDSHSGEAGGDEGALTQGWLIARAEHAIARALRAGAELSVRFPGATELLETFAGTSPELRAGITWWPEPERTTLNAALGFRLDRGRESAPAREELSLNDRVGLGASDSHALLLGISATRSYGMVDVLGEWSWDVYVGDRAPAAIESPMRIILGGRLFLSRALHVQLLAGVSPSGRPEITADGPLYVVEPRVFFAGGIGGLFGGKPVARRPRPVTAAPVVTVAPPRLHKVSGRVFEGASQLPVPEATIEIPGHASTVSGNDGTFAIESVPQSATELRVRAQGFRDFSLPLSITSDAPDAPLELALERELPEAQIRGTVRSYRGKPIAGLVHVQPGDHVKTLDAEGTFEIEVPPGEYTVLITAKGYESQEQRIRVEKGGVTVIAVELKAEQ
jgi:hypothetical protein